MRLYLGIDIGSSSSKAAVLDEEKNILALCCVNRGTGTDGVDQALSSALGDAGLKLQEMGQRPEGQPVSRQEIGYTVVTGYGRMLYSQADKQVTEITCHARGAAFLVPGAAMVIDIGGQDSKVIRLAEGGTVSDFVMNEKCAAGTGRFLEVMARVLGCRLEELSDLAAQSTEDVPISSVCTVFAESEAISRLAQGCSPCDVAKGAHRSVAKRIAGMAGRVNYAEIAAKESPCPMENQCDLAGCRELQPLGNEMLEAAASGESEGSEGSRPARIAMTGGVALNRNMVETMAEELGCRVTAAPYPQAVGAIGAALIAISKGSRQSGMK